MKLFQRYGPESNWYFRIYSGGSGKLVCTGESDKRKALKVASKKHKDAIRQKSLDGAFETVLKLLMEIPPDDSTRKRQEFISILNDDSASGNEAITIESLGEAWFNQPSEKMSRSRRDKQGRWSRFLVFLSDKHPHISKGCEVNRRLVKDYIGMVDSQKLTMHSKKLLLQLPTSVFRWAVGKGVLVMNPFEGSARELSNVVALPVSGEVDPAFEEREDFTREELRSIWEVLNPANINVDFALPPTVARDRKEWWVLVNVGLFTGLSLVDSVMLNKSQIIEDSESGSGWSIKYIRRKTRSNKSKPIMIPLDLRLKKMIDQYCDPDPNGFLLSEIVEKYNQSRVWVSDRFLDLLRSLKIQTTGKGKLGRARAKNLKGFHSLRHTFTSRVAQSLQNPMLVQRALGHKTIDMTAYYTHVDRNKLSAAIEAMELP